MKLYINRFFYIIAVSLFGVILLPAVVLAATTATVESSGTILRVSHSDAASSVADYRISGGTRIDGQLYSADPADFNGTTFADFLNTDGSYAILSYVPGASGCGSSGTYATCSANTDGDYYGELDFTVVGHKFVLPTPPPPPTPPPSLGDMIAASENGMASTSGFYPSSVAQWVGDNLIKVFIGAGLAVIFDLRYWIVAALIISAVIYFTRRGFLFFRH